MSVNKPISPEVLAHYGVLGMKWGVRKDGKPQGHQYGKAGVVAKARTKRMATKDAAEYTKAKMFYGQGAGTRRKLINAKVEQRKKDRPGYAEAFESRVSGTDMAKRSKQAKGARKRADVKISSGKAFRGTTNMIRGNPQAASAAVFATFTLGSIAYKNGAFDYVKEHGPTVYSNIKDSTIKNAKPFVDSIKNHEFSQKANSVFTEATDKFRNR